MSWVSAPVIGQRVDVYDGDIGRWITCDVESVSPAPYPLPWQSVVVCRPVELIVDTVKGLRQIYGVPWPDGASIIRNSR